MPDSPAPSAELGRRVRALHDAAHVFAQSIEACASPLTRTGRLSDPAYKRAVVDLAGSKIFRRLVAETAAFRAFLRHIEPGASFPMKGDTDNEGCSEFHQDNSNE